LTGLLLLLPLVSSSQTPNLVLAQGPQTTAFVNVNIIPMETEQVLENQTVIVEGDRITAIGPAGKVTVTAGAQVVEGEGAYLMPGLADMHMHFGAFPFEAEERPLKLFIANGVTTVRDLSSQPLFFQWEKEIAAGSRVGPQIYKGRLISPNVDKLPRIIWRAGVTAVIGFILFLVVWLVFRKRIAQTGKRLVINVSLFAVLLVVGYILTRTVVPSYQSYAPVAALIDSPWEARKMVYKAKAAGYDFIKPYDALSQAEHEALMKAAQETDMYVAGHIPEDLGLYGIIAHGQDEVVHLEELVNEFFGGGYKKGPYVLPFDWPLDDDPEYIEAVVNKLKESNTTLCVTMITDEVMLRKITNPAEFLQDPIIENYLRRDQFVPIEEGTDRHMRAFKERFPNNFERWYPLYEKILREVRKAGVNITLGTDAGLEGIVHGFTVHDELRLLTETGGYTPYEAIASGTKNAAGSMDDLAEWGTITVGKRADLILVNKNPLEDVAHIQDKQGVMAAGRWYPETELQSFLKESVVGP
jgi:imidazolonepropionase-like amidohydrolase